jgi:hypothetical protein
VLVSSFMMSRRELRQVYITLAVIVAIAGLLMLWQVGSNYGSQPPQHIISAPAPANSTTP